MTRYVTILFLLWSFLFVSYAYCARLNESDVIALAKEAAQKAGYKLEQYEEPNIRFRSTKNDWVITFHSKINYLDHFFVWIDDQTGNTKVIPGE